MATPPTVWCAGSASTEALADWWSPRRRSSNHGSCRARAPRPRLGARAPEGAPFGVARAFAREARMVALALAERLRLTCRRGRMRMAGRSRSRPRTRVSRSPRARAKASAVRTGSCSSRARIGRRTRWCARCSGEAWIAPSATRARCWASWWCRWGSSSPCGGCRTTCACWGWSIAARTWTRSCLWTTTTRRGGAAPPGASCGHFGAIVLDLDLEGRHATRGMACSRARSRGARSWRRARLASRGPSLPRREGPCTPRAAPVPRDQRHRPTQGTEAP